MLDLVRVFVCFLFVLPLIRTEPDIGYIGMIKVFTIGYEGASLDDFIATLKLANIQTLLDVREFAGSRRKGFAKTALKENLLANNINYHHEKRLGSPKDVRNRLRADGNYEQYFKDFNTYIETQKDLLEEIANNFSGNIALMCYERDYTTCHRRVVAEKLGYICDIKPQHLGVQKGVTIQNSKSMDTSQSLSAA